MILEPVENVAKHALLVSSELMGTTQCQDGLVGMLNPGDTCYINAVLQALSLCATSGGDM